MGETSGGGSTNSTVTQQNMPDWLRPQTEAMIGAATQELFQTVPNSSGGVDIVGVKPYTPYSADPSDYVAGFSPLQQQVMGDVAGMTRPGQFQTASDLATLTAIDSRNLSNYGAGNLRGIADFSAGNLRDIGSESAGLIRDAGEYAVGIGDRAAGVGAAATGYGGRAAQIGLRGLEFADYGLEIGNEGREYSAQLAALGDEYGALATDPNSIQEWMNPYVQNVLDIQKQYALRDAEKAQLAQNLGAASAGTYGGARQLLATTERERNLAEQMAQIQAEGQMRAYDDARAAQQYRYNLGLQGLTAANQGLSTAVAAGNMGVAGLGQAIAGQRAGIEGVSTSLQGQAIAMQAAQAQIQAQQAAAQAQLQSEQIASQAQLQAEMQAIQAQLQGQSLAGQQANTLSSIGAQQMQNDLMRMQAQLSVGAQQQAQQQQIIDQAIQNFAMAEENPMQKLAQYNSLLQGLDSGVSQTKTEYAAAPSAASQALGMGTGIAGFLNYTGGLNIASGGLVGHKRQGIDTAAMRRLDKKYGRGSR